MRTFAASLLLLKGDSFDVDVVIVGAGTSGLVAAKSLVEARPDLKIQVLEQRSRVGGRTKNLDVPGHPGYIMEGGGTWLGQTQDYALNLTKELGLELYHTYYNYPGMDPDTKTPQYQLDGQPSNETVAVIDQIESIAREVGTEAPWAHARAAEYDALTLGDWLKQQGVSKQIQKEMANVVAIPLGASSLDDVSFLFYLFFSASCPFRYDSGFYGAAQDFRLVLGSQAISDELLKRVERAGVQVRFNTTVQHMAIAEDGIVVSTAEGVVRARHAIVALGTGDARRLAYSGLTPEREQLHASWINNVGLKFFFVFDRPFWRDDRVFGKKPVIPADGFFFDYTPYNATSPGIIAGFFDNSSIPVGGKAARRAFLQTWLTADLGLGTFGHIESYVEQSWDLETEGGTANIVQYFGKGVLSKVGAAWRAPIGRLHWAGSDTAQKWMGYISGAIESGERTAQEVMDDLPDVVVSHV